MTTTQEAQVITWEQHQREINELKAQVRSVAKKYTTRHGWCNEVNNALEEAGLGVQWRDFGVTMVITRSVNVQVNAELTEEQAAAAIHATLISGKGTDKVIRVLGRPHDEAAESTVIEGRLDLPGMEPVAIAVLPAGYGYKYTSGEGRVRHVLSNRSMRRARDGSYASSMCGKNSYSWSDTSSRDEGRVCNTCATRTGNVTGGVA